MSVSVEETGGQSNRNCLKDLMYLYPNKSGRYGATSSEICYTMNYNTEVLSYGVLWMVNDYFSNTGEIAVDINILRTRLDENYLFCTKQQNLFHSAAKFSDVEGPISQAI